MLTKPTSSFDSRVWSKDSIDSIDKWRAMGRGWNPKGMLGTTALVVRKNVI